eukprot:1459412-Pyramimonas_sp.AAC.1
MCGHRVPIRTPPPGLSTEVGAPSGCRAAVVYSGRMTRLYCQKCGQPFLGDRPQIVRSSVN